jgi:hypothetical protein
MFVDTKGVIKSYRTDNTMVKRKRTKNDLQTLHRKA